MIAIPHGASHVGKRLLASRTVFSLKRTLNYPRVGPVPRQRTSHPSLRSIDKLTTKRIARNSLENLEARKFTLVETSGSHFVLLCGRIAKYIVLSWTLYGKEAFTQLI
jgi:hypothetical protein